MKIETPRKDIAQVKKTIATQAPENKIESLKKAINGKATKTVATPAMRRDKHHLNQQNALHLLIGP